MAVNGPPVSLLQAAQEYGVGATLSTVRSAAGLPPQGGLLGLAGRGRAAVTLAGAAPHATPVNRLDQLPNRYVSIPLNAIPVPSNATGITYLWEYVSGESFSMANSTAANPGMSFQTPSTSGGSVSGVYRCKISQGATVFYTNAITINVSWSNA